MALCAGAANAGLCSVGTLANPGTYFGTGNTPGNWSKCVDHGAEVALRVDIRFDHSVAPVGNTYYVNLGDSWNIPLSSNECLSANGATGVAAFACAQNNANTVSTFRVRAQNAGTDMSINPQFIPDNSNWGLFPDVLGTSFSPGDYGFQQAIYFGFPTFAALLAPGYDPNANEFFLIDFLTTTLAGAQPLAMTQIGVCQGDPTLCPSVQANAIPEPGTLALLGLAGIPVIWVSRRRKFAAGKQKADQQ
jgi:hypothetical protein